MKPRIVALVAVLALAGCSSGPGGGQHRAATTTPRPVAGPTAFLAFAHHADFGDKDFTSATDAQLLDIANLACDQGLAAGLPFGRVVQGYVQSDAKPTPAQAEAFARAAVKNLCPEFATSLP